jgi:hypothetical protein
MLNFNDAVPTNIADILNPAGAQAYPVPTPDVSMTQLLAGGILPQQAAPSASAPATQYSDSPAPGAAAQMATPQTSSNEPGWAQKNPVQAQMLMQMFTHLAAGGPGNGWSRMGDALGAANNYGLLAKDAEQTKAAKDAEAASVQAHRNASTAQTEQQTQQGASTFDLKKQTMETALESAKQNILNAKTALERSKAEAQYAQVKTRLYTKYGEKEAQQIIDLKDQELQQQQEAATQGILKTDRMAQENVDLANLSPEQRAARLGATKDETKKKPYNERFQAYIKDHRDAYTDPRTSLLDVPRAVADFNAVDNADQFDPEVQKAAWAKARASVKPGENYQGPDGKTYTRGK